ncbi:unnamed protein product [Ostreobium quekettii]|uniref:RING-type domain-containing protein n=1 Tax=Ostreobium quekettii TaxID=121088 RepID=A0A8S1IPC2_9CHLO|nr:unnamed protein product [Ostreobium quekettii]|eukprot:evm.model.scf_65.8 EVM.evm.TU.scf_65.8   scf_65:65129-74893(-)
MDDDSDIGEEPTTEEDSDRDDDSSDSEMGFVGGARPARARTAHEEEKEMEAEIRAQLEDKLKTGWASGVFCFLCRGGNKRKRVDDLKALIQHAENFGETAKAMKQHKCLGQLLREEFQRNGRSVDLPDGTAVAERVRDGTGMASRLDEHHDENMGDTVDPYILIVSNIQENDVQPHTLGTLSEKFKDMLFGLGFEHPIYNFAVFVDRDSNQLITDHGTAVAFAVLTDRRHREEADVLFRNQQRGRIHWEEAKCGPRGNIWYVYEATVSDMEALDPFRHNVPWKKVAYHASVYGPEQQIRRRDQEQSENLYQMERRARLKEKTVATMMEVLDENRRRAEEMQLELEDQLKTNEQLFNKSQSSTENEHKKMHKLMEDLGRMELEIERAVMRTSQTKQMTQETLSQLVQQQKELKKLRGEKEEMGKLCDMYGEKIKANALFKRDIEAKRKELAHDAKESQRKVQKAIEKNREYSEQTAKARKALKQLEKEAENPEAIEPGSLAAQARLQEDENTFKSMGIILNLKEKDGLERFRSCRWCKKEFGDPPPYSMISDPRFEQMRLRCRALLVPCNHVQFCWECANAFWTTPGFGKKCADCAETLTHEPAICRFLFDA